MTHLPHCQRALLPALLAGALVAISAPARALPPAQTILYVGTDAPLTDSTNLSVAVYGWAIGKSRQLGVYAGPSWDFMDDRLNVSVRGGAYVDDRASPLLNCELYWEDGNYNLDLFNDFYYAGGDHGGGMVGVYSWLSGQYWYKGVYFGAMADMTKDKAYFQLNAGPVIGIGNKKLAVGVSPIFIKNSPKDETDGFGVRFLVDMEFEHEEDKPCKDCDEKEGKGEKGDDKAEGKDDAKKDDDAKPADDKGADKDGDKKEAPAAKEEPAKDEPKADEPKKDEPKKEEPAKKKGK